MEETTLQSSRENQETAEEPAQSPPVERVTEKVKDPKQWQPGVPALPPERQSKKNDFSSSFEHPRNHFAPPPRLPIFLRRRRTKRFPGRNAVKDKPTGPHGSLGLVLRAGRSVSPTNEVPRWWRQAPLTPRPSSVWINTLSQIGN